MTTAKRFTAPVAVHLFLLRDGQVLLLRRKNTGYEDGNYSVIAGHLDGGEPVWAAAIREAREEAGIEIAREALIPVGVMHRRAADERIDFFFAVTEWSGEIVNAEPEKCDELAFYPLDRLPPNVIPYVRRALENFRSGRWFDGFGWDAEPQERTRHVAPRDGSSEVAATVERFRSLFPVTERMLFLNHASESPVPAPVRRRIEEYLDTAAGDPDAAPTDLMPLKRLLSRLLGGSPEEYAVVPNTGTGINLVALGLDWRPGDNVVVPEQEYPANLYPWLALRDRGVEVRIVPLEKDLRVDPDRVAERIDSRTRVVAVSAVEYLSGFRNDLPRLAEMAHRRGALFVVDGIQAAGVLPIHVDADGIDVLAAGGYKWLLGPIGTGFVYIRRQVWNQIRPVLPGARSSVQGTYDPEGAFTLHPHAGRYETGCLPFSLLHGWTAGLEILLEAGIENVAARVLDLTDRLIAGLQRKGIAIASPVARREERSGIISFTLGSSEANLALERRLRDQGIIIAVRGGRCRVSPHFYNTPGDIDRLLGAI